MKDNRQNFRITTDKKQLNISVIHKFLSGSYWAKNVPVSVIRKSIKHSLCFGVYKGTTQVGFARVITDYTTFAYIADVFVLKIFRGRGLSKKLMETIMAHPKLQGLRRWMLATRDAQGLYQKFGFKVVAHPENIMEIRDLNIYSRGSRRKKKQKHEQRVDTG